jgi:hypothetical protein
MDARPWQPGVAATSETIGRDCAPSAAAPFAEAGMQRRRIVVRVRANGARVPVGLGFVRLLWRYVSRVEQS